MPFDLSKSKLNLCSFIKIIQETVPNFSELLSFTESYYKGDLLYWNLFFNQGYVVVDTNNQQIYFAEAKTPDVHQECHPALAQIALSDIIGFLEDIEIDYGNLSNTLLLSLTEDQESFLESLKGSGGLIQ